MADLKTLRFVKTLRRNAAGRYEVCSIVGCCRSGIGASRHLLMGGIWKMDRVYTPPKPCAGEKPATALPIYLERRLP